MDGQMTRIPREAAESNLGLIAFLSLMIVFYKGFVFMQKEEL